MSKEYGYTRISTPKQNINRQVRNILAEHPQAHMIKEVFTGTKFQGRKELDKLLRTVKSGDTLWDIARVKLGNGTKWQSIYNLNKAAIEAAAKKYGRSSSSNGWWIYPGTVLKLPG